SLLTNTFHLPMRNIRLHIAFAQVTGDGQLIQSSFINPPAQSCFYPLLYFILHRLTILLHKKESKKNKFERIFYLDKSAEVINVAAAIMMRKNSLLSSLLLFVNIYQLNYVTAFIIDNAARTTNLFHHQSGLDLMNIININNNNRNDEESSLTRLHATSSFDEQANNHDNNIKRTTALNAATGMSLPSALSLDDNSSSDTSSDMGVGVLFLNLGGPKTGDDVEGTLR
ncbi:MAG: hypothetical protein ACI90V_011252, partial [Bacillariaceae sp.]